MYDFRIGQYCRYSRNKHDRDLFAFCLFIEGGSNVMEDIAKVEYTLHPSFPDPVRVSTERGHSFKMESEAWGEFTTYVRVFHSGGEVARLRHPLKLARESWPLAEILTKFDSDVEAKLYASLLEPKWEWRKISTLARRAQIGVHEAASALRFLEKRGAARPAYFRSIDNEELWGATSVVGLLPAPI